MKPNETRDENRTITLAELCEALEDGRLASQRDGEYYIVRRNDLRHFADSNEQPSRVVNLPIIDRIFVAS